MTEGAGPSHRLSWTTSWGSEILYMDFRLAGKAKGPKGPFETTICTIIRTVKTNPAESLQGNQDHAYSEQPNGASAVVAL